MKENKLYQKERDTDSTLPKHLRIKGSCYLGHSQIKLPQYHKTDH